MAVDYRKQYTPEQLEPFWPNEIIRMVVVVLCTLAVIMGFVVLPVLLDSVGLGHWMHEETPANPRATPPNIHPEWYFLAVYQYLKLPPQEFLGISGKTIGVLSQGPFVLAVLLLPFWGRRWANRRPRFWHRFFVTVVVFNFAALTFWPIWPPPPLFTILFAAAVIILYSLLAQERRTIRRVLYGKDGAR
jgi:quinol-cytochrome oxidoreductase complex cytochrome b subunit